jgi:hypothetical protein
MNGNEVDLVFETRLSNCLYSQLMTAEYCSTFYSTLGLLLSIINYEKRLIGQQFDDVNKMALFCNFMCTLFLVMSVYIRYDLWLKWSITI